MLLAVVESSEIHNWHRMDVVDSRRDFGLVVAVVDNRSDIETSHNRFAGNVALTAVAVHHGYPIDHVIRVVCGNRGLYYDFCVHDVAGMVKGNVFPGVDDFLD